MSAESSLPAVDFPSPPRPLWRHPAFAWTTALMFVAGAFVFAGWGTLAAELTRFELALAGLLPAGAFEQAGVLALPLLAFGAGLLASLSPCVLPLVPLNLALIGAAGARGRAAVSLSSRFVLGAALALAALGLLTDAAGWLFIEQRGPVLIAAGFAMVLLAAMAVELVPFPLAGRAIGSGRRLGPVAAGAAFSVVTTPCASPLVGGILAAAAAQALPGLGVVSMIAFSLGYTALVFTAGVFGGDAVGRLRTGSLDAPRAVAAAVLLVAGLGFAAQGALWFA